MFATVISRVISWWGHPRRGIAASRRLLVSVATLATLALPLSACAKVEESAAKKKEPVTIEKIAGTDLSRLTLDARAAERIGLQTRTVDALPGAEGKGTRLTVPYGAVLYDAKGTTFVYTNPQPLVFVRHPIVVDVITGDTAVLSAGPPPSSSVVTVGGSELVGIEFGVGK